MEELEVSKIIDQDLMLKRHSNVVAPELDGPHLQQPLTQMQILSLVRIYMDPCKVALAPILVRSVYLALEAQFADTSTLVIIPNHDLQHKISKFQYFNVDFLPASPHEGATQRNPYLCGRESGLGATTYQGKNIASKQHLSSADSLIVKVSFMLQ